MRCCNTVLWQRSSLLPVQGLVPHDRCLEPHDEQIRIQLGSIEPMPIAEVPIIRYLEKCYGMYDIHLSEEVPDYFIESFLSSV